MGCPGLSPQRRVYESAILPFLRGASEEPGHALCERIWWSAALPWSSLYQTNTAAQRVAGFLINRSTGSLGLRTSVTAGRRMIPYCSGGCSRSITFWNTRCFPGFPPSRKRSLSLSCWASTATGFPTASITEPWGNKPATLPSNCPSRRCQIRHLRLHRSGQYHRHRTALLGRGARVALEGFAGERHQGSGGSNRLGL